MKIIGAEFVDDIFVSPPSDNPWEGIIGKDLFLYLMKINVLDL